MEKFFYICISFDNEIEIKELILKRYANSDYIFNMELMEFLEFIKYAKEEQRKERYKAEYNAILPYMHVGYLKIMSFKDYYDKCTGANIDMRSNEEIIKELEEAHGRKLV